jgi:hypothetical protein
VVSSNFPGLVSSIKIDFNFGELGELFKVLCAGNSGRLDPHSRISKAMQCSKVGEISLEVEVLKSFIGSFFGFMSSLSSKCEVTDATRSHTIS